MVDWISPLSTIYDLAGGDWNMTFIFPYIGNDDPIRLIFFEWDETTNQIYDLYMFIINIVLIRFHIVFSIYGILI